MPIYENVPLTLDAAPPEVRKLIPITATTDDFKARLTAGGTMELIGTTWTIGERPDYSSNRTAFIALDKLILKDSTIVTNGNILTIIVNELVSNNGRIISIPDNYRKAKKGTDSTTPGKAGDPGEPGDFGGVVSIHVIQNWEGTLDVNLRGQDGGDGGAGTKGATGTPGVKGANAVSDGLWCRAGGQDGSAGGQGFPGTNGGDGGTGGHGGVLYLFQINKQVGEGLYRFSAQPGAHGVGGNGGAGGDGGPGGEGGNGSGPCGGGRGGPAGPPGTPGQKGNQPTLAPAAGQVIAKSINLEVSLRMAISGGAPDPARL